MNNPYLRHHTPTGRVEVLTRNAQLYTYFNNEDSVYVQQDHSGMFEVQDLEDKFAYAEVYVMHGKAYFKHRAMIYVLGEFTIEPFLELPDVFDDFNYFSFACTQSQMFISALGNLYVLVGNIPRLIRRGVDRLYLMAKDKFLFMLQQEKVTELFTEVEVPIQQFLTPVFRVGSKVLLCENSDNELKYLYFDCETLHLVEQQTGEPADSDNVWLEKRAKQLFDMLAGVLQKTMAIEECMQVLNDSEIRLSYAQFGLLERVFVEHNMFEEVHKRATGINSYMLSLFMPQGFLTEQEVSEYLHACMDTYLAELTELAEVRDQQFFAQFLREFALQANLENLDPELQALYEKHKCELLERLKALESDGRISEQLAQLMLAQELSRANSAGIREIVENTNWRTKEPFDILIELKFEELAMDYLDSQQELQENPISQVSSVYALERLLPRFMFARDEHDNVTTLHIIVQRDQLNLINAKQRAELIKALAGYKDDSGHSASFYVIAKHLDDISQFYDLLKAEANYLTIEDIGRAVAKVHETPTNTAIHTINLICFIVKNCAPQYRAKFFMHRPAIAGLERLDVFGFGNDVDAFGRPVRPLPNTRYKFSRIRHVSNRMTPAMQILMRRLGNSAVEDGDEQQEQDDGAAIPFYMQEESDSDDYNSYEDTDYDNDYDDYDDTDTSDDTDSDDSDSDDEDEEY